MIVRLDGGNLAVLAPNPMDAVARAAVDDAPRVNNFLPGMEPCELAEYFLARLHLRAIDTVHLCLQVLTSLLGFELERQ